MGRTLWGKIREKMWGVLSIIWWVDSKKDRQNYFLAISHGGLWSFLHWPQNSFHNQIMWRGLLFPFTDEELGRGASLSNHVHTEGYMANKGQSHDFNPNLPDPPNRNAFRPHPWGNRIHVQITTSYKDWSDNHCKRKWKCQRKTVFRK